jgi:uncharacterized protein YceK
MSRPLTTVLALGSLALGGCGTFSDGVCGPIDDHAYYRGVRLDVAGVKEGGPMTLMAADIPFSAVADTLLVPYIAYQQLTEPPRQNLEQILEGAAEPEQHKSQINRPADPKD